MNVKKILLMGIVSSVFIGASILIASKTNSNELSLIPEEAQPIVTKMLNAIDHYKSLEATIKVDQTEGISGTVAFALRMEPHVMARSDTTFADGRVIKEIQNNNRVLGIDEEKKTYKEDKISEKQINKWKYNPKTKVKQNKDGGLVFFPRQNPILVGNSFGMNLLFPQSIALGVLHRAEFNSVEKNQLFLGRSSVRLDVSPIPSQQAYYGNTLKLWIDEETGILLKQECYLNGEKFKTLEITSLELNTITNDRIFHFPSVENYTTIK
ncbi:hypothetical protein N6H14_04870 [Paenibacillus sp. CC-CFT747]|nr:hypothetical protein N6H14_04870 [Paenibacillus sp. CC-CFT747]